MPDELEKSTGPLAGATASAPAAPPVAGAPAPGLVASPAAAGSAVAGAPLFGGLRGGRPRKDGLIPGSDEAREADRLKDAERKRKARAAAPPPPLPPAEPALDAPPAEADGGPVLRGGGELPLDAAPPPDWAAEDLQSATNQLVAMLEDIDVRHIEDKCKSANLDGALVAEIVKDARWNASAKKSVAGGGAPILAKVLNKLHVPKGAKPVLDFIPGLGLILAERHQLNKRLDALIEVAHKNEKK